VQTDSEYKHQVILMSHLDILFCSATRIQGYVSTVTWVGWSGHVIIDYLNNNCTISAMCTVSNI